MRSVLLVTLGLSGVAFAADPAASTDPATTEVATPTDTTAAPTPTDCSSLEGEAKTTCEAASAAKPDASAEAVEEPKTEKAPTKGKAKRSNTNRMESETEDE